MTTSSAAHTPSMNTVAGGYTKLDATLQRPVTDIVLPTSMIGDVESIYLPDGRTACLKPNSRRINCRKYQLEHDFFSRLVLQPKAKRTLFCASALSLLFAIFRAWGQLFRPLDKLLPPSGNKTFRRHLPVFPARCSCEIIDYLSVRNFQDTSLFPVTTDAGHDHGPWASTPLISYRTTSGWLFNVQ